MRRQAQASGARRSISSSRLFDMIPIGLGYHAHEPARPPLPGRPRRPQALRPRRRGQLRQPADAVDADPQARGRTRRVAGRARAAQGDADAGRRATSPSARAASLRRGRADARDRAPQPAIRKPAPCAWACSRRSGPYLLPHVVPRLRARFPRLELLLVEEKTDDPARAAARRPPRRRPARAAAARRPAARANSLFDEPFLLAVPEAHPLAKRESLRVDDLADERLLLLEDGHCLRDQALDVCQLAGAGEKDGFRATSLETLRQMVAANVGMTLLPMLAVKPPVRALEGHPPAGFRDSHRSRQDRDGLAQAVRRWARSCSSWRRCSASCRRSCCTPTADSCAGGETRGARRDSVAAGCMSRAGWSSLVIVAHRAVVWPRIAAHAPAGRSPAPAVLLPPPPRVPRRRRTVQSPVPAALGAIPPGNAARCSRSPASASTRACFRARTTASAAKPICRRPTSRSAGAACATTRCCRSLPSSQGGPLVPLPLARRSRRCRRAEIVRSSANMHMIPADEAAARALSRVRAGECVRIDGWLVEVDARRWLALAQFAHARGQRQRRLRSRLRVFDRARVAPTLRPCARRA